MTTRRAIRGNGLRNLFGALLHRRGITSQALAEMTGTSESTVRSWRRMRVVAGRLVPDRSPKHAVLVRIADALGIEDTEHTTGPRRVLRLIRTAVRNKQANQ